jgi:hypothetical protein
VATPALSGRKGRHWKGHLRVGRRGKNLGLRREKGDEIGRRRDQTESKLVKGDEKEVQAVWACPARRTQGSFPPSKSRHKGTGGGRGPPAP